MATIKVDGISYFISNSKITTPSIKIDGQGYIPLFSGDKGSTVEYNRYSYTLGGLKVGNYHAAISRAFINHAPVVSINVDNYNSVESSTAGTRYSVYNNTYTTLTAIASDADGDSLTYAWYHDNVYMDGEDSNSISVRGYIVFDIYRCEVTDQYGLTTSSDNVIIHWVSPPDTNHWPSIRIITESLSSSDGNIEFTISFHDDDSDHCTITYGYLTYTGTGGQFVEHSVASFESDTSRTDISRLVSINNVPRVGNVQKIYARIVDSKGAVYVDYRDIQYVAPQQTSTYKCTVVCSRALYENHSGYGPSKGNFWVVDITTVRCPSQYTGLRIVDAKVNDGDRVDGTHMMYDNRHKPSTIRIQPYTIQEKQVQHTQHVGSHTESVTVTEYWWVSSGPTHDVAVNFPATDNDAAITFTFEWD